MIPSSFEYARPSTVEEAVRALAEAGEDAKVLAGGQSLLPVLRMRLAAPTMVVDLGRVPELRGVTEDGDDLVIGAMTTHYDVHRDHLVQDHASLLARATETVADPQVRHRGTFGGSLAHADPAGDLPAVALALEAVMVVEGPAGRREIPAGEFFVDYFTTSLAPDELLVAVRIPKRTGWLSHYEKFNRVAQAWSIVAVGVSLQLSGGTITDARIGLTNMASVPVRAVGVEQALIGQSAGADVLQAAAAHAAEGTSPGSDGNGSAEYRSQLARVLTGRALAIAVGG
ncbi:FAD binding domain-containing protein [Kutzneria chonburiensis]|uniref:FAD binding domain-containing protein n=1 Tax=Kutzneria chonburiensis TaxID=1483604 RepID=A0ABV6N479_9PSEU|nr:xanthine dehydrogenase family protein subunit M [Kutzneria chonburiensis]